MNASTWFIKSYIKEEVVDKDGEGLLNKKEEELKKKKKKKKNVKVRKKEDNLLVFRFISQDVPYMELFIS